MRPSNYQYVKILQNHLGGSYSPVFNGKPILPRQLEVHLPSDRKEACNFHCFYCQGKDLAQDLGHWEEKALSLMDSLQGGIPFYVYGGAYTEPLMNEYFADFLRMTKRYGNNFGCHSNGSLLVDLEDSVNFCSTLISLGNTESDYYSCSLDAGSVESHKKTKKVDKDWFSLIIDGLRLLVDIRGKAKTPKIRVCYLMNKHNSSSDEIHSIVTTMRKIGVDSLRFSIPYMPYGHKFDKVARYSRKIEFPQGEKFKQIVDPFLSKSLSERPYIFWHGPEFQDVNKMTYKQCIYSYYQITFGADGYVYKCSSTATPTFKDMRLGKVTDNLDTFMDMVSKNHSKDWNASTCFSQGARCNRIALEINELWNEGNL